MGLNLITDDMIVANSRTKRSRSTNTPSYTSPTAIEWNVENYNDGGGFSWDGSGQVCTCNFDGYVKVSAGAQKSGGSFAGSVGLFLDSPGSANGSNPVFGGITSGDIAKVQGTLKVSKGDSFSIQIVENGVYVGNDDYTYVTAERVPDYSAGSAAGFATAESDKFGLVKKDVFQVKNQSENRTTVGVIAGLTFSNLTVGKVYTVHFYFKSNSQLAGARTTIMMEYGDGTDIIQVFDSKNPGTTTTDLTGAGGSYVIVADQTSIQFNVVDVSGEVATGQVVLVEHGDSMEATTKFT